MRLQGVLRRIAWVDLSRQEVKYESPPEDVYASYLGGYGIGAYYLYNRQPAGVDALGPENTICVATGPLTGTDAITGNRFTVCAKSPKTEGWGDANCGGRFGPALKQAGLDAVFVRGCAEEPVYLLASDTRVEILDASPYWGGGCSETEDRLREQHGSRARAAVIGPVGERVRSLACIIHDRGRAAARSGLGMVFGSKRLKAIVAIGAAKVPVAQPDELHAYRKRLVQEFCNEDNPFWLEFHGQGTPGSLAPLVEMGDTPIKNWAGGTDQFPGYRRIGGDEIIKYQQKRYACWGCPIACGGWTSVPTGPYAGEGHKPEYETIAAFGSMCLNDNVESLFRLNNICNEAGMDTISAGCTLAFAMECFENGIIDEADTGGVALRWGDHAAMVEILSQIAEGRGFGNDVLADGVRKAAQRLGSGADKFAVECGGEELPMHDPRCYPGAAASYVVDATPARHTQFGSWYGESHFLPADLVYPEMPEGQGYAGKGEAHKMLSSFGHLINLSGLCQFGTIAMPASAIPEYFKLATGWAATIEELLEIGERVASLRIAFNLREGIRNCDRYQMPPRCVGHPPMDRGPTQGVRVDTETQLRDYYEAMGWNPQTGVPTRAVFERLGLDFALDVAET